MNDFSVIQHKTKTRFSRILEEMVKTFYLKYFGTPSIETDYTKNNISDSDGPATKKQLTKTYFLGFMKRIYKFIKNSLIIDLLLFIPNKISEIDDRGEELIIIAKST